MNHEVIDDRHLTLKADEFIGAIRTAIEKSLGDGLDEDIVPKGTIFKETAPKFMLAQKPAQELPVGFFPMNRHIPSANGNLVDLAECDDGIPFQSPIPVFDILQHGQSQVQPGLPIIQ
jgi:hypothetical protein